MPLPRFCFAQVWYDNRASDLTKEGMLKGIERAAAFVLFLSTDVLQRPYCQLEIRHALALKKPIVLLHGKRHHTNTMHTACTSHSMPACSCRERRAVRLLRLPRRPCRRARRPSGAP